MKTRTGGAVPIINQYDTCQLVQKWFLVCWVVIKNQILFQLLCKKVNKMCWAIHRWIFLKIRIRGSYIYYMCVAIQIYIILQDFDRVIRQYHVELANTTESQR